MQTRLINYNAAAQHMGTWLSGYDWSVFGCGTYRAPVNEVKAQALMKRFVERLTGKLHSPVSYFAALERRYSGCGHSPVRVHWHFLAAGTEPAEMADEAERLWSDLFGDAKVGPYDSSSTGAYYVCKLASHQNCTILDGGMERLKYNGPTDLIAAAQANPYVPDHLKDKVFGEFLRVRPLNSARAVVEPNKPGRGGMADYTQSICIRPGDPRAVRGRHEQISSPSASRGKRRPASRQAAGHGALWEFSNTELHKTVWIPPSH